MLRKKKTNEEYETELLIKKLKVYPIERYVNAKTKILHRCNVCNHEWNSKSNNILSGFGCPACAGNITIAGKNDLWTTNPEIAKLLENPEDGYKYSKYSNQKVNWKYPDCNSIIQKRIVSNITQQGLRCDRCSDGISIPNKFIANILDSLGVDFETEKSFEWIKNRRYDAFINEFNCIIEMHGGGHYKEGFCFEDSRTLEEEKQNDNFKEESAKDNNIIDYIIIDARYSELEYMKNSILNSRLSQLIDLSNVDWNKCFEKSLKSNVIIATELWNKKYTVAQICKMLHLSNATISSYLRKTNKLNLCVYLGIENKFVKVICLTTGEIFNSLLQAKEKFNLCGTPHIVSCCQGKRHSTGKLPDGTKLTWMYYDDYLKLNIVNNESDCEKSVAFSL